MSGDGLHDALVNAARLAHLDLSESQARRLFADAERILAHVERMGALELEGVEALTHPLDRVGELSADEEGAALPTDVLMGLSPEAHPPFVKVPKVIDDGGGA